MKGLVSRGAECRMYGSAMDLGKIGALCQYARHDWVVGSSGGDC